MHPEKAGWTFRKNVAMLHFSTPIGRNDALCVECECSESFQDHHGMMRLFAFWMPVAMA
jgi:hypothetical protein